MIKRHNVNLEERDRGQNKNSILIDEGTGIIKSKRPSSNTRPYKEKMEWDQHREN